MNSSTARVTDHPNMLVALTGTFCLSSGLLRLATRGAGGSGSLIRVNTPTLSLKFRGRIQGGFRVPWTLGTASSSHTFTTGSQTGNYSEAGTGGHSLQPQEEDNIGTNCSHTPTATTPLLKILFNFRGEGRRGAKGEKLGQLLIV